MTTTFNPAAAGSYHGLRYVPEATFGTTPATPAMVALRHTSCGLNLGKNTFQSAELRSDRQISDLRHGVQRAQGDIGIEFSYGEFDPFLEAALFGAWATNVLKAGTTMNSFTMERAFADVAKYAVFLGCMVNTFSLSIQPDAIVTGSFGIIGKGASYGGTPLDASPTASQTNSPFDAFTGALYEGGVQSAVITGMELNLQNGLDPAYVIGSDKAYTMTPGRSNLTGTVSALFTSTDMLTKFLNETESSLSFTLGDGLAKSYTFDIPRLKYSGGELPASGEGRLVLSMPFQALVDATEGTNLKITRIPGA